VLILLRLTYVTHASFQVSTKSNSLKICSLDSGGAESPGLGPETPGFPDIPDLAWRLRVVKVYIPLTAVKNSLSPLSQFHRAPSPPRRLLLSPWAISTFPPAKSSESEGVKAPRCGDHGSTQDSKDSSLLPSLSKVFKGAFPDLLP
jgi:hypothetical protein